MLEHHLALQENLDDQLSGASLSLRTLDSMRLHGCEPTFNVDMAASSRTSHSLLMHFSGGTACLAPIALALTLADALPSSWTWVRREMRDQARAHDQLEGLPQSESFEKDIRRNEEVRHRDLTFDSLRLKISMITGSQE